MGNLAAILNFVGEAVADFKEIPVKKGQPRQFQVLTGGSAVHSALGAARMIKQAKLNIGVRLIGTLSNDVFGNDMMRELAKAGVDTSLIARTDTYTTSAFVTSTVVRRERKNDFTFHRDAHDNSGQTLVARIQTLKDAEIPQLFFFGSISTILEPEATHKMAAAKAAREMGAVVYYDLNTRPKLITSWENYRQRIDKWADVSDIIKMSSDDAEATYPTLDAYTIAYKLQRNSGVPTIVYTDGAKGAQLIQPASMKPGDVISQSAKPLHTPNTVGAGDNFNAGFGIGLVQQGLLTPSHITAATPDQLRAVLRRANLTAERHLMRNGATLIAAARDSRTKRH